MPDKQFTDKQNTETQNNANSRNKEDLAMLSPIEDIIEEARNGRMYILVDDEDRENEGDLVIPAQMATPDAINFMAKFGRGLICLTMTASRLRELELPLMAQKNTSRHETAFTISIEAREGVTTGISASDRARTVAVAIDPTKDASDIASPGHVFPLEAREGGVLVRTGHTEATVDISRLAGLNPSSVICEIMNEDGTMARMQDLVKFAQLHNLKIGAIADLIAYRLKHDRSVVRKCEHLMNSRYGGDFNAIVYTNQAPYAEHIALVKGNIVDGDDPVLVRMHALDVLEDVLGETASGKTGELQQSMKIISEEGRGVIVLIREPFSKSLSSRVQSLMTDKTKIEVPVSEQGKPLRDYGVGAQILLDLGIRNMILLSNTQHNIVGLDGYGLTISSQRTIPLGEPT